MLDLKRHILEHEILGVGEGGTVQTIVAGTNVTVDSTDPANPIISATGSGGESPSYLRTVRADSETVYSATNTLSDSDSDTTWKIVKEVTSGVTRNLLSLYTATDSWDNYLTATYILSKTYNL